MTTMDKARRKRLESVMRAMAEGDEAMVFTLVHEFGPELERAARYHVRSLDISATHDEIRSLVTEFAMALFDASGGWRPDGGALPWVWASRRLRQLTIAGLLPSTYIDDVFGPGTEPGSQADEEPRSLGNDDAAEWSGVLAGLAKFDVDAEALWRVLSQCNGRSVEVFLMYRVQKAQGDPSPSETVANQFGLTPANVRQIARRISVRLGGANLDVPVAA